MDFLVWMHAFMGFFLFFYRMIPRLLRKPVRWWRWGGIDDSVFENGLMAFAFTDVVVYDFKEVYTFGFIRRSF